MSKINIIVIFCLGVSVTVSCIFSGIIVFDFPKLVGENLSILQLGSKVIYNSWLKNYLFYRMCSLIEPHGSRRKKTDPNPNVNRLRGFFLTSSRTCVSTLVRYDLNSVQFLFDCGKNLKYEMFQFSLYEVLCLYEIIPNRHLHAQS